MKRLLGHDAPIIAGGLSGRFCVEGPDAAGPPSVTRGAKSAEALEDGSEPPVKGIYLAVDWVRFVASDTLLEDVRRLMVQWLGDATPCKGLYNADFGEVYANGAKLCWGHPSGIVIADFSGAALAPLNAEDRHRLVREFRALGCRATRFDACVDFVGQRRGLYERALRSCERGELCRAKRFSPYETRSMTMTFGKTLYIGLRGKMGSGRLGRLYDKGLETGTMAEGEWERYEIEHTKETADRVSAIFAAHTDAAEALKEMLVSAFEFRAVNGRTKLSERPFVPWFAALVEGIRNVRQSFERPKAEFMRWARWTRRCVLPTLKGMAKARGLTMRELLSSINTEETNTKPNEHGGLIEQFCSWWDDRTRFLQEFDPPPGLARLAIA